MTEVALLSVHEKKGIVEFAKALVELGWVILASGGTAKTLSEAGVPVQDIAYLVGEPILGHQVVTLSREINAGLMARSTAHLEELERLGIPQVGLVCVDLYPLRAEIARPGSTWESVIEQTDIGGPTMLRAAAKGRRIVICDPGDRQRVIEWLRAGRPDEDQFIMYLAAKAELAVANYCGLSASYHSGGGYCFISGRRVAELRYGENPWQVPAALYTTSSGDPLALDRFEKVAGVDLGFMNLADVDRLLQTVTHIAAAWDINFGEVPLIAVAAKHGNPCGAAVGKSAVSVLQNMVVGDPQAIFGGIVMTNFPIVGTRAEILLHYESEERRLLDGIIAPSFSQGAIGLLRRTGAKGFLLQNAALERLSRDSLDQAPRFRMVRGGLLHQPNYTFVLELDDPRLEKYGPTVDAYLRKRQREADLLLAWAIGSTSNSNTITIVREGVLIGNGVGQQDRVGAAELALKKAAGAGHDVRGAVAYSDSFFPFPDGPKILADAGIAAILASSGSLRDEQVIDFCRERRVTFYLIPDKLARGFFGH